MGGKIPFEAVGAALDTGVGGGAVAVPEGYNLSILCGLQPGALLSVAVVDLDSAEALYGRSRTYPNWRGGSRRAEVSTGTQGRCARPAGEPPSRGRSDAHGGARQRPPDGRPNRRATPQGHVYEVDARRRREPWTIQAAMTALATIPSGSSRCCSDGEATATDPAKRRGLFGAGKWRARGRSRPRISSAPESARWSTWAAARPRAPAPAAADAPRHGDQAPPRLPVASLPRIAAVRAAGPSPGPARRRRSEAVAAARRRLESRCVDTDGETPYPVGRGAPRHKVGEASRADRLPGPRLLDLRHAVGPRARERARNAAAAWARADIAPEGPGERPGRVVGGGVLALAPTREDAPERRQAQLEAAPGSRSGARDEPRQAGCSATLDAARSPSLVVGFARAARSLASPRWGGGERGAGSPAPRVAQDAVAAAIERARRRRAGRAPRPRRRATRPPRRPRARSARFTRRRNPDRRPRRR